MKLPAVGVLVFLYAGFVFGQTPAYDMEITIHPSSKQMSVRGTITIPAQIQERKQIHFALSELMRDVQIEIVAPVPETRPQTAKTLRSWARSGWGQHTWSITPKETIPANTPVRLGFRYQYSGGQSGFVLSASERCIFASGINSAWYPQVEEFPRTDDGIRLRGLRGVGTIRFLLPTGWHVYSPGIRTSIKDQVRFAIEDPVFFSFAAARYLVSKNSGVALYQMQDRKKQMDPYLTQTAKILKALSAEFGPYRFPEFAIAEVPPDEADAAGFAGASLDGFMLATTDFLNQKFNAAYYGHEIGHQWWGGLVRPDGSEARWLLTEAMAQYGSLRAVEILEGPEKAEIYRRKGYPGYMTDQSGFGYLMLSAAGVDVPLTKLPADGALPRWLADSKGFLVWEMLSREMGRKRFSNALKNITKQYAGLRISWNGFKKEVNKFSDHDLGWFFQQWFERAEIPEWHYQWTQKDGKLSLQMSQQPPYFKIRVPAKVIGENQELMKELQIEGSNETFVWDIPFPVRDVQINPNFEILAWTAEYKLQATALVPFTRASLKHNDGDVKQARELFEAGLRSLPNPDPYGVTFLLNYGLATLLFYENEFDQSRRHLEIALNADVKRQERLPWAYLRLAEIADKQKDSKLVCSSLQSVMKTDESEQTGAAEHTEELSKKHGCAEL